MAIFYVLCTLPKRKEKKAQPQIVISHGFSFALYTQSFLELPSKSCAPSSTPGTTILGTGGTGRLPGHGARGGSLGTGGSPAPRLDGGGGGEASGSESESLGGPGWERPSPVSMLVPLRPLAPACRSPLTFYREARSCFVWGEGLSLAAHALCGPAAPESGQDSLSFDFETWVPPATVSTDPGTEGADGEGGQRGAQRQSADAGTQRKGST